MSPASFLYWDTIMIKIAQAQINTTVGDIKGNVDKIVSYIKQGIHENAAAIAFPELAITGYPPEDLIYKEHFVRQNVKALKKIASLSKKIIILIGFIDAHKSNVYNAAAVCCDGKVQKIYHKQKLPNYGVFDERRYFSRGRSVDSFFKIKNIKCAVNICEDIWHENGPYIKQAQKGAKIIFNLSSSPYDYTKYKTREKILQSAAQKTGCHIFYTNLVGGQDELVFDGGSMAFDDAGKLISAAKQFEEGLLITNVVKGPISATDAYSVELLHNKVVKKAKKIETIYRALALGTKDYISKNGFKKVVIGLSGGIDSAVVAAIAVEAVGADNVVGVSMPSRYSSKGTRNDAKQLAQNLNIEFKEIPILPLVDAFSDTLKPYFKGLKANIAEENIQARIRGNLLMALSNKFGWLVLTTGNKSEMAVGYCTLYGDMCGGFAVIKDVPKTMVYDVARFINSGEKEIVPNSTIERPPTAELRPNQKDQDSLPDYDMLDAILTGYVEQHQSLTRLSRKSSQNEAAKVIGLVDRSEYKRRQAPPGIKITPRAFGRDWRLPITNQYKE